MPAILKEHKIAGATWRRLMRLYNQLEAEIVSKLDFDLLADYCILVEQVYELDMMRRAAWQVWESLNGAWDSREADWDIERMMEIALRLTQAANDTLKLDGRVDRKRALLLQLRQSLYLTPRARAGVVPASKDEPPPPDDLEQLLNDVTNELNMGHEQ